MSIPKVIHYCWFGGNDLPDDMIKCIDSWKKYCPNYKIVRWDESNYNYRQYIFSKEAYEHKKWAFVSDVARLDIIYQYGGFYLDTDVELIKPLDSLLCEHAFMGFERGRLVATGLGFGAEKGNKIIKGNLDQYINMRFISSEGNMNLKSCPLVTAEYLDTVGLVREDRFQTLDEIRIFPSDYFCPMLLADGSTELTENTISIHHYAGSWTTNEEKKESKKRIKIYTRFGRIGLSAYDGIILLKKQGIKDFLKRLQEKIKK